jgi:hypothetical protein
MDKQRSALSDETAIEQLERRRTPPAPPIWMSRLSHFLFSALRRSFYVFLLLLRLLNKLSLPLLFIFGFRFFPLLSLLCICIAFIWGSMVLLRNDHAAHIHTLWYLFFLITYCGIGIYYYLDSNNLIALGNDGQIITLNTTAAANGFFARALQWYLEISADAEGEFTLLSILVGAVVVPQILAFFISGLAGCGTPPLLVVQTTKFATLSLIKFFCVFAALELSAVVFELYRYHDITILHENSHAMNSAASLAVSFIMSAFYYSFGMQHIFKPLSDSKILRGVWAYMTRFRR